MGSLNLSFDFFDTSVMDDDVRLARIENWKNSEVMLNFIYKNFFKPVVCCTIMRVKSCVNPSWRKWHVLILVIFVTDSNYLHARSRCRRLRESHRLPRVLTLRFPSWYKDNDWKLKMLRNMIWSRVDITDTSTLLLSCGCRRSLKVNKCFKFAVCKAVEANDEAGKWKT